MTARTIKAIALLAFAAFALIVYGANAQAAPFAFCKASSPAANKCVVTGHATLNGEYPIVDAAYSGQRGALIDVAGVPTGVNNLSVTLKSDLWGVLGVAVPFSFTRPTSADLTVELIQLVP